MNFSAVSFYDNVKTSDSESMSCFYNVLNLLNVNANLEIQLFCPLCINSFSFRFTLFEHLRKFHSNFLSQVDNPNLKFKECPFCRAKFYGKHLTAKHILHHHYIVVKSLLLSKNKFKCAFCNTKLSRENCSSNVKHIEELHFLDFVKQLKKMFLNNTIHEMIQHVTHYDNLQVANYKSGFMNVGTHLKTDKNSFIEDFDEASKINCYDFTDLKQQLESLKDVQSLGKHKLISSNNPILRNITNSNGAWKSARRVLRFDLTSDDEDKENSTFSQTLNDFKQVNLYEYNFLCGDFKSEDFFKCDFTVYEKPQHCSTPNSKFDKLEKNQSEKEKTLKPNLKPDQLIKKPKSKKKGQDKKTEFKFQCGKCRLLFKENLELVFHVKNSHKRFTLNAFQPVYLCAVCNAKFYRNYYLKKHHSLHKAY